MLTEEKIIDRLKQLVKPKRLQHILGVAQTAEELAGRFGADPVKARLAGLLHDCARDLSDAELLNRAKQADLRVSEYVFAQPLLAHGPVGAVMARGEFGITDEEILNAIAIHTVGQDYMSMLDKILYVADKIEPGRRDPALDEARAWAGRDLDRALLACFDQAIKFVLKMQLSLHPGTVKARNALLQGKGR